MLRECEDVSCLLSLPEYQNMLIAQRIAHFYYATKLIHLYRLGLGLAFLSDDIYYQ